jgi:hypothetical protein
MKESATVHVYNCCARCFRRVNTKNQHCIAFLSYCTEIYEGIRHGVHCTQYIQYTCRTVVSGFLGVSVKNIDAECLLVTGTFIIYGKLLFSVAVGSRWEIFFFIKRSYTKIEARSTYCQKMLHFYTLLFSRCVQRKK